MNTEQHLQEAKDILNWVIAGGHAVSVQKKSLREALNQLSSVSCESSRSREHIDRAKHRIEDALKEVDWDGLSTQASEALWSIEQHNKE